MKMTGNTILITGGGSGIGRGLAESFAKLGNKVIISGRRREVLEDVANAHSGIHAMTMDMADEASLAAFTTKLLQDFPELNVVINNAGIMEFEDIKAAPDYVEAAERMIRTNLLGPIWLTASLLPHLLQQAQATVMTVSSGLAFVPLSVTPTYSATKAAIHSYSMSLRQQLKGTPVDVIEIAPPYVQTGLTGSEQAVDPRAMPLADFIAEVMEILAAVPASGEVIVKPCEPLRYAERNGKTDDVFGHLNSMFE